MRGEQGCKDTNGLLKRATISLPERKEKAEGERKGRGVVNMWVEYNGELWRLGSGMKIHTSFRMTN